MSANTLRKSVPLGRAELEVLDRVREPGSPERGALHDLIGTDQDDAFSEAEGLRAIIRAGIERIEERVLFGGYAAMAKELDEEDRTYTSAARRRSVEIASRD
ncbi:hypothetical protein [Occultella kanbiaonis]|uniref:hypothetical protein n=1 Tax=Occultella kanbiaonis TaxID=2675754 RepID=UPI0013D3E70C|nr:hypothetical protein [Occultella kanbiaonis]